MMKVCGQALWMSESGSLMLGPYAQRAVIVALSRLMKGQLKSDCHPDVTFSEIAKAEVLVDPPPASQPILSYAIWYRRCLEKLREHAVSMCCASVAIRFGPPDLPMLHEYVVDIYVSHADQILWIDLKKTHPTTKPTTVLEAILTPTRQYPAKGRRKPQ